MGICPAWLRAGLLFRNLLDVVFNFVPWLVCIWILAYLLPGKKRATALSPGRRCVHPSGLVPGQCPTASTCHQVRLSSGRAEGEDG